MKWNEINFHFTYIASRSSRVSPHDTDSIYHQYSSTKTDTPVFHLDDGTYDLLCNGYRGVIN